MIRFLFYIVGVLFCSLGLMFCIMYFNLLTLGYSFSNLVHFIIRRGECQLLFFGIFFLILAWKGHVFYELLLRRHSKF